ncbi:MAG: zinc-dependent metalloprotease [Egibacteraceae bacterium]
MSAALATAAGLADWRLARQVAWLVASASNPPATRDEVARLREQIARLTKQADEIARASTGLGADLPPAGVRVVGRRAWIESNLASLAWLTDPVADRLLGQTVNRAVATKALALQLGVVFGYLATKVLGQYEVFLPDDERPGRLTLVGPNLLELERTLLAERSVPVEEFRFGVILHELAHRLQFEAVPWLRAELKTLLDDYLGETTLDPDRLRDIAGNMGKLLRDPAALTDPQRLLALVLSPRQQELVGRAQTLMSLLEGHGNAVMDWGAGLAAERAGIELDPTRVRTVLNERRSNPADQVLRRALGLSMKAQQYRVGEAFILQVVERYGRAQFDAVWERPEHVPTAEELEQPDQWARRVPATG